MKTPEEDWRVQWLKNCEYNNQDEPIGLNNKACYNVQHLLNYMNSLYSNSVSFLSFLTRCMY